MANGKWVKDSHRQLGSGEWRAASGWLREVEHLLNFCVNFSQLTLTMSRVESSRVASIVWGVCPSPFGALQSQRSCCCCPEKNAETARKRKSQWLQHRPPTTMTSDALASATLSYPPPRSLPGCTRGNTKQPGATRAGQLPVETAGGAKGNVQHERSAAGAAAAVAFKNSYS